MKCCIIKLNRLTIGRQYYGRVQRIQQISLPHEGQVGEHKHRRPRGFSGNGFHLRQDCGEVSVIKGGAILRQDSRNPEHEV